MQTPAASGVSATKGRSAPALVLAALASLLASSCCVLPLVLAVAGISGAWISQLRVLQAYSSSLLALAAGALGLAAWRLFGRPSLEASTADAPMACDAEDRSCRASNSAARRWFWLVTLLSLIPLLVPLLAPFLYD